MAEFARVLKPGGHLVLSDIHVMSLYIGGIPAVAGPGAHWGLLPASHLLSDYLTAALQPGFQPRSCAEPARPASDLAGGPLARQWRSAAADRLRRDATGDHLAFPVVRPLTVDAAGTVDLSFAPVLPNSADFAEPNPVPLMMTLVPPALGALDGEMDWTVW
jgi:hypothetical protein